MSDAFLRAVLVVLSFTIGVALGCLVLLIVVSTLRLIGGCS